MDGRLLTLLTLSGLALAARSTGSRGAVRAGRPVPVAPPRAPGFVVLQNNPGHTTRRPAFYYAVKIFLENPFPMSGNGDLLWEGVETVSYDKALEEAEVLSQHLEGARIVLQDEQRQTIRELQKGRPGAGIPVRIATNPRGLRSGLHVEGLVEGRWILAGGDGLDSDEEVSQTIDRWFGPEVADRLFREAVSLGGSRAASGERRAVSGEQGRPGRAFTHRSPLITHRSSGSRGAVRRGRTMKVPHDPLAERFYQDAGYSHRTNAGLAQVQEGRRTQAQDLAKAWRALQEDPTIEVVWEMEVDPDTSWMDPDQISAYESGDLEILTLTMSREGRNLDTAGGVVLSTGDNRKNRWDRELQEAWMALALGLGSKEDEE